MTSTTIGDSLLELVNSGDIQTSLVPYQDPFTIIIKNFEKNFAQRKKEDPQYEKWNGISIDYSNAMVRYYYNKNPKGEHFKYVLNNMIGFCRWWTAKPPASLMWNKQTKNKNELTDTIQTIVDGYTKIKETDLVAMYDSK